MPCLVSSYRRETAESGASKENGARTGTETRKEEEDVERRLAKRMGRRMGETGLRLRTGAQARLVWPRNAIAHRLPSY